MQFSWDKCWCGPPAAQIKLPGAIVTAQQRSPMASQGCHAQAAANAQALVSNAQAHEQPQPARQGVHPPMGARAATATERGHGQSLQGSSARRPHRGQLHDRQSWSSGAATAAAAPQNMGTPEPPEPVILYAEAQDPSAIGPRRLGGPEPWNHGTSDGALEMWYSGASDLRHFGIWEFGKFGILEVCLFLS